MSSPESIWIKSPLILVDQDRVLNFIPTLSMSYAERINAIVRFSMYLGVVLSFLHRDYLYLYIPIFVLVVTYLVYLYQSPEIKEAYDTLHNISSNQVSPDGMKKSGKEFLDQEYGRVNGRKGDLNKNKCVGPTKHNPFMNPMLSEPMDRGKACPINEVKEDTEDYFNQNLFKDVTDIYDKRHSQRQYYTVPATEFGGDQGAFAEWLYGQPPTCKEGNGNQCIANISDGLGRSSYQGY